MKPSPSSLALSSSGWREEMSSSEGELEIRTEGGVFWREGERVKAVRRFKDKSGIEYVEDQ